MTAPDWKQKTPRDKKFLQWLIKGRPCELRRHSPCSGDLIYHHSSTGGTSLKGSDYKAICTCFGHHNLFDNATKKGIGLFRECELNAIIAKNLKDYEYETKIKPFAEDCPF